MYIARQPIFNTEKKVYGYELLFRGERESQRFDGSSGVHSTASVIAGLFESGIEQIVENKKAFINFDHELMKMDFIELIPPHRLVVEILEDVVVSQGLQDRIQYLSKLGYQIALDDFSEDYGSYPLIKHADIIKYDLIATPLDTLKEAVEKALKGKKVLLAEKIEREEDFQKAKTMGFTLFQGFFFSKPSIIGGENRTKTTSKTQYMRLIQELQREEPSFDHLAEVIGQDVNLAYRFIRVISGRTKKNSVDSIKKALTYIGLKELERWIHVLMIQELGSDKPRELVQLSLVRSKFSEGLARCSGLKNKRHEAALMGLFSTIDALMDMKMEEALKGVSLSETVRSALLEEKQGDLAEIVQMIKSYEKGQWSNIDRLAKTLNLKPEDISNQYLQSVEWAKRTMADMV